VVTSKAIQIALALVMLAATLVVQPYKEDKPVLTILACGSLLAQLATCTAGLVLESINRDTVKLPIDIMLATILVCLLGRFIWELRADIGHFAASAIASCCCCCWPFWKRDNPVAGPPASS
jgi:hypothetical protein